MPAIHEDMARSECVYINGEDVMIDGGPTLHGAPRWYSLDYTESNACDWDTPLEKYPYRP
jgi:hypothetical protein